MIGSNPVPDDWFYFAGGGIRFRLLGGELGAEFLDLHGGRLRCLAGVGIGSVRHGLGHGLGHGLRHGLRLQVDELA